MRTLAKGMHVQDLGDNCPGPYAVGVTRCDVYLTSNSAKSPFADATLRFESANAYWFVDDTYAAEFTEANLAQLAQIFENEVVPVDARYFGDFPDVDSDGKIFIVFTSLDTYGYVSLRDLFSNDEVFAQFGVRSNEGNIFYGYLPSDNVRFETGNPDVTPEQARADYFSKWFPQTMVHELKHLIAGGIRLGLPVETAALEELWAEEASAVAAEELSPYGSGATGYAQTMAAESLSAPENYRVVDDDPDEGPEGPSYYGYNFLHLWRVAERVGHDNFWKSWTAGLEIGVANIEKNAPALGSFANTMTDWAVTLMFDHTGLLSGYDYEALNLRDGSWQNLSYQPLLEEAFGGGFRRDAVARLLRRRRGQQGRDRCYSQRRPEPLCGRRTLYRRATFPSCTCGPGLNRCERPARACDNSRRARALEGQLCGFFSTSFSSQAGSVPSPIIRCGSSRFQAVPHRRGSA